VSVSGNREGTPGVFNGRGHAEMWTLYSIGDPVFLQQVLNAVAMLFGSADFLQFVAIGFLIGVLIVPSRG
jgi:hypothetical protein